MTENSVSNNSVFLSGGSSRALLVGALAVRSLTYPASALGDILTIATTATPVSFISVFPQDFKVPRVDAAERDLGSAGKGSRKLSGSVVCPTV